jgi:single-strand DNA-binding protein
MVVVTAHGNLTDNPGQRVMPSGVLKSWFRIACSRRQLDRDSNEWQTTETVFIDVVCWGRVAGNAVRSLHKGDSVVISGRLLMREYEKDGVKRTVFEILATSLGPNLANCPVDVLRPAHRQGAAPSEFSSSASDAESGAGPEEPDLDDPTVTAPFAEDAAAALA